MCSSYGSYETIMNIVQEVIEVRGELYLIKRKVRIDNEAIVDDWKDH